MKKELKKNVTKNEFCSSCDNKGEYEIYMSMSHSMDVECDWCEKGKELKKKRGYKI